MNLVDFMSRDEILLLSTPLGWAPLVPFCCLDTGEVWFGHA
jgi:hypothetical protein